MHPDDQQEVLTVRLFGLFLKCPFGEATDTCPFTDIRTLGPLELKFQLAERMAQNPDCQKNIHDTHEACYRKRMLRVMEPPPVKTKPETRRKTTPPCRPVAMAQL